MHVARRCRSELAAEGVVAKCDLALLFLSSHHIDQVRKAVEVVREELSPRVLVGISAESVLAGETELERQAGMSLIAAALPGVTIDVFHTDNLPLVAPIPEDEKDAVGVADHLHALDDFARAAGFRSNLRGTLLFIDPFSVPINAMLPTMVRARDRALALSRSGASPAPIIGGMASASARPAGNVLIHNDTVYRAGGLGVSLSGGAIRIDPLVSQGCRPIGPPMVITAGKQQLISGLGGHPALLVLSELLESLDEATKVQVRRGLFIGRAVTEYKERFGRDDFVIRGVIGINQSPPRTEEPGREGDEAGESSDRGVQGAIAVADLLRVGQTVQFHVRDAKTATEDLAMLLDAQQLYERPLGAVVFTCNGRGTRMFAKSHHDAAMLSRGLSQMEEEPGPDLAKGGMTIAPAGANTKHGGRPVPIAGFFAGGEIGPVGPNRAVFVHGQSVCAAIFREDPELQANNAPPEV